MNWGRVDGGKKLCFTKPKPNTAATKMPATAATVIQRKRIQVASKPR